jgi:hypothetical protein
MGNTAANYVQHSHEGGSESGIRSLEAMEIMKPGVFNSSFANIVPRVGRQMSSKEQAFVVDDLCGLKGAAAVWAVEPERKGFKPQVWR